MWEKLPSDTDEGFLPPFKCLTLTLKSGLFFGAFFFRGHRYLLSRKPTSKRHLTMFGTSLTTIVT
ncbi:hypothetical protein BBJ41_15595 [Burkholderia stabilis]|nr:hypothetical protein BBJ41_15595 [Burkholderia stabilis]